MVKSVIITNRFKNNLKKEALNKVFTFVRKLLSMFYKYRKKSLKINSF